MAAIVLEGGGGLEVRLRSARLVAGLSQAELAARAGVTRQAVSAVEGGRAVPTTAVALRLARALGRRVEELFRLVDALPTVEAELLAGELPPDGPTRLQVAEVGGRVLAFPVRGRDGVALTLAPANGLLRRAAPPGQRVRAELFGDPERLVKTLVLVGCDPAAGLLADHLRQRYPAFDLITRGGGSLRALQTLERGEAHLAGCHLQDEATGEYNLPLARRLFGERVELVTFAVWQAGLIVAAGNPRGIRGVADLARPDLRLVNREPGTGARALLDTELRRVGLPTERVAGHRATVGSHLAVAEAVAAGLAEAGVGVQAAAQALGLGFVPLAEQRYDLVIPRQFLELAPLQALLETLHSPLFRLEVEALGGYDVARMGSFVRAA